MKILVVVDAQNDFVTGELGCAAAQEIVNKIAERVKEAREKAEFVVFTQDTHSEDYENTLEAKTFPEHCIYKSKGWEVVPELIDEAALSVYKSGFGSFDLVNRINGVIQGFNLSDDEIEIELCGFITSVCVLANAVFCRSAFPNIKISVNSNLCYDNEENNKAALICMKNQLIEVIE